MRLFSIFILCSFLLIGCAAKPNAPTIDMYSFKDNNYPCSKIEFPDQIRLKNTFTTKKDGHIAVIYNLKMPGYKIQIAKLYAGESGLNLDSIASAKNESSKLYEIDNEDEADKSAVITVENYEGKIYLKGSVAEFFQSNKAIRVDVFRQIKNVGAFKSDAVERWKNSTTGNRTIINMRNIIDYIYRNINSIECKYKDGIDINWWD